MPTWAPERALSTKGPAPENIFMKSDIQWENLIKSLKKWGNCLIMFN